MKNRIAIVILISIIAVVTLSACSAVNGLSAVNDTGKIFMAALRDGDHAATWDMLVPEVQIEVGSQAAWADFTTKYRFTKWKFTETKVDNDTAQSDGEATLGAHSYSFRLVYAKINDNWKISGVNFTQKK